MGSLVFPPKIEGTNQVGLPPRIRPPLFTVQLKGFFDLTAASSLVSQRYSIFNLVPYGVPTFPSGGFFTDAQDLINVFDYARPLSVNFRYEPQQAITSTLTPILVGMSSSRVVTSSITDDTLLEIPNTTMFDPRYSATLTYKIPRITALADTTTPILRGGWIPTAILAITSGGVPGTIYMQKNGVGVTSGVVGRVYVTYTVQFRYQE